MKVRHSVLAMTVLLAGITYLDRVCVSITAPLMMRDLGLTPVQMSFVFSAFTLAYGLFEIPTGWWGDRVGTRRVLTRIVIWWSIFTMATAGAFHYASLLATRFLFGAGEAGAWPNVARTFSRWIPKSERGTAQGIFFMGAHLSGGLTPLLVTAMLGIMPWRALFLVFGCVGFVWALVWWRWFRDDPGEHAQVQPEELALIRQGRLPEAPHGSGTPWRSLLANRHVAGLCLMYFTQVYGFYFYITWLPTYLKSTGKLAPFELSVLSGLPLMLSVLADLFGGIATDRLSRRWGPRLGRAVCGGASLFFGGIFVIAGAAAGDLVVSAVLIAIGGGASAFLLGAAWGTCIDIGGSHSGVIGAAMNTAGQVGGFLSPIAAAFLVRHYASWSSPLYLVGVLYLLGSLCWLWINPAQSVDAA